MIEEYVDLNGLSICSRGYLTGRKHPGLVVKQITVPLTDEDLQRLGAARFEEPAVEGYARTGKAVDVGGILYREYMEQPAEEAAAQAKRELKLSGIEFEGVMCSATAQDMWGLSAIRDYIADGGTTPFEFDNGNVLVLTPVNMAAFRATWEPFRASFFG